MMGSSAPEATAGRVAGAVLVVLFLALAALVFVGIFLLVTTPHQFWALFAIGLVALVFAIGAYFAQAFAREPTLMRAVAYGFGAFGFGVLFLTTLLFPFLYSGIISLSLEVDLLILLVLFAIVPVGFALMGARNRASEVRRAEARQQWRASTPPSAFSYAAAQPPAAPPAASDRPGSPPGGA